MEKHKVSEADLLRENTVMTQNRKRISEEADLSNRSLLKKNEVSLVFLGAAIFIIIIGFLFFRTSGDKDDDRGETATLTESVQAIEERLTRLEEALQTFQVAGGGLPDGGEGVLPDIEQYAARVERVETALSVKFDVMTARVDNIQEQVKAMAQVISKNRSIAESAHKVATSNASTRHRDSNTTGSLNASSDSFSSNIAIKKAAKTIKPVSTVSQTTQKVDQQPSETSAPSQTVNSVIGKSVTKTAPVYHIISKGDTLYNISKKYNTTVPHLRKINGMTTKDAIIIGQKLKVKE